MQRQVSFSHLLAIIESANVHILLGCSAIVLLLSRSELRLQAIDEFVEKRHSRSGATSLRANPEFTVEELTIKGRLRWLTGLGDKHGRGIVVSVIL